MALYDSENNRLLDADDNVLLARATFTVGTQEANKVFVGENEVKAIYIGTNLVYEKEPEIILPQLSAPVISLSGDILTIEEVENAEYYDIYVDGVLEESVPAVSGYSGSIDAFSNMIGFDSYTKIKFDTPPENDDDYDAVVNVVGVLIGASSYTNKTKIYVWGSSRTDYLLQTTIATNAVKINNVVTLGGISYDTAVEVSLTGNDTIYLGHYSYGGSN